MAINATVRRFRVGLMSISSQRAILAVALAFAASSPALANLIVDSMRYDGHVKSGATTGVEAHFSDVDLKLPFNNTGSLPANNSALPAPLVAGNNLTTTLTEAIDTFNGMPARHVIITISSLNALNNIFNNTLDPGLPLPVSFDGVFYSDALAANEEVILKGITVENFAGPFPPPGSQLVMGIGNPASPLGSAGNPMRIQLGISADQVDDYRYGFVKLNLFYGTEEHTVPELASGILMLIGLTGLAAVRRLP